MSPSSPITSSSRASISQTAIFLSPSKPTEQVSYDLPQVIKSNEGSRFPRLPPELWRQIAQSCRTSKDIAIVSILSSEIYAEVFSLIEHIKITKTKDIPAALDFARRVKAKTITFEGCEINVESLKDLPQSLKCLEFVAIDLAEEKLISILRGTPNLTSLNMFRCGDLPSGVFGKILKEMWPRRLEKLEMVNLWKTEIDNIDLVALLQLTPNLTSLDVSDGSSSSEAFVRLFKKRRPHSLALKQLKTVNLSHTQINNIGCAALLCLTPNLTSLDLSSCTRLSPYVFVDLINVMGPGALPQLKTVNLSYTNIDKFDLSALMKLAPNVASLNISGCRNLLPDVFVDLINTMGPGALPQLKTVNLWKTKIDSADFAALLQLAHNLISLDISDWFFDALPPSIFVYVLNVMGPLALQQLQRVRLEKVNRHGGKIENADIAALLQLAPNLTSLEVSMSKDPFSSAFSTELPEVFVGVINAMGRGALKQLKTVKLLNTEMDNPNLIALLQLAPNITSLNVNGCLRLLPGVFVNLLKVMGLGALEHLKTADLSSTNINDADLGALMELAPNLTSLNVSECEGLTPGIFVDMLKAMGLDALKQLKTVNLRRTSINNADLAALLQFAPNITSLNVSECERLTPGALALMKPGALERLEIVDLSSTKIDDADLNALLQHSLTLNYLCLKNCLKISQNVFKNTGSDLLEKLNRLKKLGKLELPNDSFNLRTTIEPTTIASFMQRFFSFG